MNEHVITKIISINILEGDVILFSSSKRLFRPSSVSCHVRGIVHGNHCYAPLFGLMSSTLHAIK